jgi:hypothetical protein
VRGVPRLTGAPVLAANRQGAERQGGNRQAANRQAGNRQAENRQAASLNNPASMTVSPRWVAVRKR